MNFVVHKFQVGEKVTVKAWWTVPKGQPVLCVIEAQSKPLPEPYYDVRPAANPGAHVRFVNEKEII